MIKYIKILFFIWLGTMLIGILGYYIMPIYMENEGEKLTKLLGIKRVFDLTQTRYHKNLNYYLIKGCISNEIQNNLILNESEDFFKISCGYFEKIVLDSNKAHYSNLETRLDNLRFVGFYPNNCYSFWQDDSVKISMIIIPD